MRLPTGHIRKRGNVWWCQWKHAGIPYAESLRTRDAQEARREFERTMARIRAEIADGSFLSKHGRDGASTIRDGDILLADAWRHYRGSTTRPDASPQSLRQYEYQWGRLLGWLRARHPCLRRVSQVTRAIAQEFAAWLAGQVSASTYNRYVQLFRLAFRVLLDDIGIEANPWKAVQKRKNGNGAHGRRPFTAEELRRIFETLAARSEGRQLVWGADGVVGEHKLAFDEVAAAGEMLTLCLLGFHTGLRLGDCCLLAWQDVDLGKGVIATVPRKTARSSGRKVVIPIHPELAARLAAIRPEKAQGPLCPTKARQYAANKAEVAKRFRTLFRQCGIRTRAEASGGARAACEVGFHSFRHTWVTRAAEDGVDPITIREVVGWGSPAMERTYTHVSPEHVRTQMGKRTSTAFPSADGVPPSAAAPTAAADVAAMGSEEIRELAKALAEELSRRGNG
jgi:integrase